MDTPALPPSRYASVFRPGPFDGRTVWVTGGGSGIGRCHAITPDFRDEARSEPCDGFHRAVTPDVLK